jgi:hypothetical protein
MKLQWTCLKNNPEIMDELKGIKQRIEEVLEKDENRHLADVGIVLSYISKDLEKISEKVFELHTEQKLS